MLEKVASLIGAKESKKIVIFMTGQSGAGKSTIASKIKELLYEKFNIAILDGDVIRKGLCKDLGFSKKDRKENIRRISEVARLLFDNELFVIVAFISPYKNLRRMAQKIVGKDRFFEVYIKCPLSVCEKRDVKGLYKKVREGKIKNFTGIDDLYEPPNNPFVVVDTNILTVEECAQKIIDKILVNNHD